MIMALLRIAILPVLPGLLLVGCMTYSHEFVGHDPGQVWSAMKTAAEQPRYDDWLVHENQAWVDEDARRIEVYRQIERYRRGPIDAPIHEERTWRLKVQMVSDNPPVAKMGNRGLDVPMHVREEALRYFEDVQQLLGEPESPPEAPRLPEEIESLAPPETPPPSPSPAADDESEPADAPDQPIDIDELQPPD